MILVMSALAAPLCVKAPATEPVVVEFVQSGEPETGFRVLPDGRWQELDGAWTEEGRLTEGTLSLAKALVAAALGVDLTPPGGVVSDAIGCTRWRLGERVVAVREGTELAALNALYVGLRGLQPTR